MTERPGANRYPLSQMWHAALSVAFLFATLVVGSSSVAAADNVLTFHNSPLRNGVYRVPDLTLAAASSMHLDSSFHGAVSGHVYAQPLFWHPVGGRPVVIVATESNVVYALDAQSGTVVWKTDLGAPVSRHFLPCGNIDPVGVTGTPVIDPKTAVVYLDALVRRADSPAHLMYGISLVDGSTASGWPLDIEIELSKSKLSLSSRTQQQRGALLLTDGALYVSYGGAWGDCGSYRGTVVQLQTSPPKVAAAWQTRAKGGGIWAPGGPASDGSSIFVTTGNTFGAKQWSDGEAVVRLKSGLVRSESTRDFFAPADWQKLDAEDLDLGGTGAVPIDIPGSPPAKRILAFGKDGNAYLSDRANLGGIGENIAVAHVSNSEIVTAPAAWQTRDAAMVVFTNQGGGKCAERGMTALNVTATGRAPLSIAWCAPLRGAGSPMITTTDGTSNAIVWVTGAEGDGLLHGYDASSGKVVFDGGKFRLAGLRHFGTLIAAEGRLYIGADNAVYAFAFGAKQ